jgi:hypothetical protein
MIFISILMSMQLNINNIKHSGLILLFTGISFLFGCSTPKTQPPSGISQAPKLERNQFISDDGYRLPITRYWPHSPEYAAPKGIVIALHGFNDYSKGCASILSPVIWRVWHMISAALVIRT